MAKNDLGVLALLAVFALLGGFAVRQVGSLDAGFQLRAGEYVLDGNGWPRTDPFSYTMREHRYLDTTWGYQVAIAAVQRVWGAAGLSVFHALLVLAAFGLTHATLRLLDVGRTAAAALILLAGLASELRFETRPELVSYLLLAAVCYLLQRRACGRRAPSWLLVPLFWAWVNLHALFVLGWAALACFFVGGRLRAGRFDRDLLRWSLVAAAAGLLNPYGWRALAFPLTLVTRLDESNPFGESIGELTSPFAPRISAAFPFYPRLTFFAFYLLVALALLALPRLVRERRYAAALLVAPFLWLAGSAVRNIPPFALACLPGIACGLAGVARGPFLRRAWVARTGAVALTVCCLALGARVVSDAHYVDTRRVERSGLGWNREALPIDAASWAAAAGLDGPVLNTLGYGGTLMWFARQPVFIDGRLEVVGETFYEEYRKIFAAESELEAAVARYGIEWIVFPYKSNPGMLRRLSGDPRWRLAYLDGQAVIFTRRGTRAARASHPSAARAAAPPADWRPDRLPGLGGRERLSGVRRWLTGFATHRSFPCESFGLGLYHYFRGDAARAAARFAQAIDESDGAYYEIYANLGSALFRLGRLEAAADCYRIVLEERPDNELARRRLAEIGGRAGS